MPHFRIYYTEIVEYETYIEAPNEKTAKEIFENTMEEDTLDPIGMDIMEYEAEEIMNS